MPEPDRSPKAPATDVPAAAATPLRPHPFGAALVSADDVARYFGTSRDRLSWLLYRAPEDRRYKSFQIPKRTGGLRTIAAPVGAIRDMQSALAPALAAGLDVHRNAHGFLPKRSIVTNAAPHAGARWVLNVDLVDFFPSINFGRVRGLFMARPFHCGPAAATLLAQLCTRDNGLPQGAPTSPVLSNYIAADLDRRLRRLARNHKLVYTRYADDITLSTRDDAFPEAIAVANRADGAPPAVEAGEALHLAVRAAGFEINPKKVRLQGRGVRQSVTGLTVNQKPNIERRKLRRLRAMIHAWSVHGLEAAAAAHFAFDARAGSTPPPKSAQASAFRRRVYGRLAFVQMVRGRDDETFLQLCAALFAADDDPPRFLRRLVFRGDDYELFIGHASEDKDAIAWPIFDACDRLGLKVFLDQPHIELGESWPNKIQTALLASKVFLAIVGERYLDEGRVSRLEVDAALERARNGQTIVVPLIAAPASIMEKAPFLDIANGLAWTGDADAVARRLFKAVRGVDPSTPPGARNATRTNRPQPAAPEPASDGQAEKRGLWRRLFGG